MKILSLTLGISRIEFSIHEEQGKFIGKVNHIVVCESTDYESVRANILNGFTNENNKEKLSRLN
jgi:hypothetical protein